MGGVAERRVASVEKSSLCDISFHEWGTMSQEIFLLTSDDGLVSLKESGYVSEDRLQGLLERHPHLMPGDQVSPDDPRRWLLVSREVGVPAEQDGGNRWSIDHLFLDQDGVPTLVEVKRSSDSRIRREVVGQMLDYAANGLVYWPSDEIRRLFELGCQERGSIAEDTITDFVAGEETYEGFWDRVRTNLKAGRVRLIFVSDRIPPELQRIVEFLNEQMTVAEVLAVEIRQFQGSEASTLVPRVLGLTAAAEQTKGRSPRRKKKWNEEMFFETLAEEVSAEEVMVARDLLRWAEEATDEIWYGEGVSLGSYVPIVLNNGVRHQLFAAWTSGALELYFYWYAYKEPFSDRGKRLAMLEKINEIGGVSLEESAVDRRPSIALKNLLDEESLTRFKAVFHWYISEVLAARPVETSHN
jgi:hypothetical protein